MIAANAFNALRSETKTKKHTLQQGEDSAMKNAHGGCMERRFFVVVVC